MTFQSTLLQLLDTRGYIHQTTDAAALDALAQRLIEHYGAPDMDAARAAADEELTFAESLCHHAVDTLIALHRTAETGEIREAFRTLKPRADRKSFRAFAFMDVEGEEDEPGERIDLAHLAQGDRT